MFEEINKLITKLNVEIKMLGDYGKELAECEKDYKISLRQASLQLKVEKDMAVTLIDKVVYGIPYVADKRFKRDVAEAMYKTCLENINVIKLQLRLYENQLNREWNNQNTM